MSWSWSNWFDGFFFKFILKSWRSRRSPSIGNESELQERPEWLDRWIAGNKGRARARVSTDQRDPIKTVEIDTSQPYSYLAPNLMRTNQSQYHQHLQHQQRPNSPLHRTHQTAPLHHSPVTPSPSKTRPLQVRSASPRCVRDDRSCASFQTPSLRSNYYYTGNLHPHGRTTGAASTVSVSSTSTLPNYMAATESAKARVRSQSAPRQRPSTPERDRTGSAKKRLSFPNPDPYGAAAMGYDSGYGQIVRSPSFKSVSGAHFGGLEQQSNYSSCCTESLGGEVSPSSTSDFRRWLR